MSKKFWVLIESEEEFNVLMGIACGVTWHTLTTEGHTPTFNRAYGFSGLKTLSEYLGGLTLPDAFPVGVTVGERTLYSLSLYHRRLEKDFSDERKYQEASAHKDRADHLVMIRRSEGA